MKFSTNQSIFAVLALASAGVAYGQTDTESEEDIFELSPFEIVASQDEGWRPQNTLAGSRMNSSLKDTPGVLDVLTSEFLEDMGVTDLAQALAFSANYEEQFGDGGATININASYPGANQNINFNVRGQGGRLARNYVSTSFRPEFYTVERIDTSSGPNAILFGVGSAGGVSNISTKRALLSKDKFSVGLRTDEFGSARFTIDANQVLVEDKLGIRVNAITSREKGYREYSDSDVNGIQIALKYRLGERTEINAEYEVDKKTGLVVDPRPTFERVSNWLDAGSQTFSLPANWLTLSTAARNNYLANPANGLVGIDIGTTGDQPVYVGGDSPYVFNNRLAIRSTGSNRQVSDDSLIPLTVNTSGPGGLKETNRTVAAVSIDHRLAKRLFLNVSATREQGDTTTYQSFPGTGGGATALTADPNDFFLYASQTEIPEGSSRVFETDGSGKTINPYAGEFYIDGRWRRREQEEIRDVVQASLAWQIDTERWGSHNVVTNYSYSVYGGPRGDNIRPGSASYDEVWYGAPFTAGNATAANNAVIRRSYVDPSQPSGFTNVPWMDTQYLTWTHPTKGILTTDWLINGPARNDFRDLSGLVAVQSYFFNRRLVTTIGYRKDEQNSYQYFPHQVKLDGFPSNNPGVSVIDNDSEVGQTQLSGGTKSIGAVYHVNKWLSTYANQSSAISPIAAWKFGPDGLRGPNQQGEGMDFGLKFSLFEDKLSFDVGYYKTSSVGSSSRYNLSVKREETIPYAWDEIFKTLNNPFNGSQVLDINSTSAVADVISRYSDIRPVWLSDADIGDNASTGYEFRMVANPAKGLRLRATFSTTEKENENQMVYTNRAVNQLKGYIADLKATNPNLGGLYRNAPLAEGETEPVSLFTIDQNLAFIDQYIEEGISQASSGFGGSKYRANFNATYDIPKVKGWTTGIGMRYKSGGTVARYDIVDPAQPELIIDSISVIGESQTDWNAMLRYRTKTEFFGTKSRVTFQLNVENLLDEYGATVRRYNSFTVAPGAELPDVGEPTHLFIRAPRSWNLSANLDF